MPIKLCQAMGVGVATFAGSCPFSLLPRLPTALSCLRIGSDSCRPPGILAFIGSLDIFHGTHFVLPAVGRAKCVLTVHDLTYLRHLEYFADRDLNERGYRKEFPRALARADAVIAISRHTREYTFPKGKTRDGGLGALVSLATDPRRRSCFGDAARTRARAFDVRGRLVHLEGLYASL